MSPTTRMAVLLLAIDPNTHEDAQRLAVALQQLTSEDSGLSVRSGRIEGQVVIGCISEQHLEAVVDRLKRDFGVTARVGRPEVAYREAPTRPADGEAKYVRQTTGRGEYGHVKIRVRPGKQGTGYLFENHIIRGAIPVEFVPAVWEGIRDRLTSGVLTGYPIDDVQVDLDDGSYHDVDSTAGAFKMAGWLAAEKAVLNGDPVLLEPVMGLEVDVPAECVVEVMANLVSRRGEIQAQQDCGDTHRVRALVPLAELFGYAMDLRSRTHGRGTCAMQFERYAPCPVAGDEGGSDSLVGAPRKPAPTLRDSRIALPEPDDDGREK